MLLYDSIPSILWWWWLLMIVAFTVIIASMILVIRFTKNPYPTIWIDDAERNCLDPNSNKFFPLPQIGTIFLSHKNSINYEDIQSSSLYLSVIVPAYNEENRLPSMLDEAIEFLERQSFQYEIIVVDDGSKDQTSKIALEYVRRYGIEKIRVITLIKNRGKGGAVRIGVLASRGEYCLFADADGATKFACFSKLDDFIQNHLKRYTNSRDIKSGDSFDPKMFPIAIGSRAHLEKESIAQRSFFRTILMYGFHFAVWLLTVKTVKDTQCGFKMFPRTIAQILFTHTHIERWAFDVELLMMCEKLNLTIGEIPVEWKEIDGSKIIPVFSWIQMGIDLFMISLNYTIGAYRYPKPPFKAIHSFCYTSKKSKNE